MLSSLEKQKNEFYGYGDTDEELYQTDGYGGSDADIDDTERFTFDIDLTIRKGATIDFKFTGSGSTDNLILYLYGRRDATWDGAEASIWSTTIPSAGVEIIYHFKIPKSYGAGHFRWGMKSSGNTDTFEMDVEMRRWYEVNVYP